MGWRGCVSEEVPAEVEEGLMNVSGAELAMLLVQFVEQARK